MPVYHPRQGNGGGGSGTPSISANLTVLDEGIIIATGVSKLNFIGTDVTASNEGGGRVNIYIPTPQYVSNFNGTNGTTTATVPNINTTTRRVSAPTAEGNPFSIGSWTGGTNHNTIRNTSISYSPADVFSLTTNTTTFDLTIYSADGATILATRTTAPITGNSDTTVNNIRFQVTNWATDIDRFKADVIVTFNISSIIPAGGRFSIEIVHHDDLGDYTKVQNDVFYDPDTVTATVAGVSIAENTVSSSKFLSGIQYYDIGDTFDIEISDIDNINHSSYPTNFVYLNSDSHGISDYTLSSGALIGWTSSYDNTNASYSDTESIDTVNYRAIGNYNIGARPIDWTSGSEVFSSTSEILIDTYASSSDDDNEDFRDEANRRTEAWGAWDSTTALTSSDLMVQNDKLMVQQGDWTSYGPANSVDYTSSGAATQCFFRGFRDDGIAHSNMIIRMSGISEAQFTALDVVLEVSLDGINWLDCNSDWIGTGGTLSDGEPVRINKATYNLDGGNPGIQITLGSGPGGTTLVSTGPDGWGVYVRLCMPSTSNVQLEYMRAEW